MLRRHKAATKVLDNADRYIGEMGFILDDGTEKIFYHTGSSDREYPWSSVNCTGIWFARLRKGPDAIWEVRSPGRVASSNFRTIETAVWAWMSKLDQHVELLRSVGLGLSVEQDVTEIGQSKVTLRRTQYPPQELSEAMAGSRRSGSRFRRSSYYSEGGVDRFEFPSDSDFPRLETEVVREQTFDNDGEMAESAQFFADAQAQAERANHRMWEELRGRTVSAEQTRQDIARANEWRRALEATASKFTGIGA